MRAIALSLLALSSLACAPVDPPRDGGPRMDATASDARTSDTSASFDSGRQCESDTDCARQPGLPVCDPVRGRCVVCTPSNDRCDPADHCDPASFTCAPGCHSDEGCAGATPRCDLALRRCVECVRADQCPGGSSCAGGRCMTVMCPAGRADCNRDASDGCEADLATDRLNCGACGAMPAETCNTRDDNCDGRCDEAPGCRVGVHRSSGAEHFYTTNRAEAGCCGFTVESENFFYLYGAMVPGTAPLYRCYSASQGRHLLTPASDCEGFTREGIIGFIGTSSACGATPLYRLYNPSTQDNFYTTSAGERDNAVAMYGYQARELAGYVWTAPQG